MRLIACSVVANENIDPYNDNSLYDNWGEALFKSFEETSFKTQELTKTKSVSKEQLLSIFKESFNIEFSIIDTTNVDIKNSMIIFNEFISMYKNRNKNEYNSLSIEMENYIINTTIISESDKSFLLKMNSILKYASFFINSNESNSNTKRSTEDCFKQKLKELENAGYIEQALCILEWPICFGAKLLDCALSDK